MKSRVRNKQWSRRNSRWISALNQPRRHQLKQAVHLNEAEEEVSQHDSAHGGSDQNLPLDSETYQPGPAKATETPPVPILSPLVVEAAHGHLSLEDSRPQSITHQTRGNSDITEWLDNVVDDILYRRMSIPTVEAVETAFVAPAASKVPAPHKPGSRIADQNESKDEDACLAQTIRHIDPDPTEAPSINAPPMTPDREGNPFVRFRAAILDFLGPSSPSSANMNQSSNAYLTFEIRSSVVQILDLGVAYMFSGGRLIARNLVEPIDQARI